MQITVTDGQDNELLFNGDADEFLEVNDYDADLEELLNELLDDNKSEVVYGGHCTHPYIIKKEEYCIYD